MTVSVRDWLPAGALLTPAIRAAFEAAVGRWSARWFGARAVAIAEMRRLDMEPALAGANADWREFAPGLFLDWREDVQDAVARHGLHAPSGAVASSGDSRLIREFAECVADDLGGEVAGLIGVARGEVAVPGSPRKGEGALRLRLAPDPKIFSLDLVVEGAALAFLRKKLCPPFTAPGADPVAMIDALGETRVPFRAILGSARLSAHELTHLAPDDVIVIDAKVAAPIALVAEGTGRALAAATLSRDGDELTLQAIAFEGNPT